MDEKYLRRKSSTKEIMETEVKAETAAAILDSRIDLHASLSTQDSGFHSYSIRYRMYLIRKLSISRILW